MDDRLLAKADRQKQSGQNPRMLMIREVREVDRRTFEQLHSDYINEGKPEREPAADGWIDNLVSQALAGQRYLWLAETNGEVVSFCSFRINPFFPGAADKYTEIQDFYITPSARCHGLGRELAHLVMQEAFTQRATSIELDVAAGNAGAMQFWQRIGFKLRIYSLEMAIPRDDA